MQNVWNGFVIKENHRKWIRKYNIGSQFIMAEDWLRQQRLNANILSATAIVLSLPVKCLLSVTSNTNKNPATIVSLENKYYLATLSSSRLSFYTLRLFVLLIFTLLLPLLSIRLIFPSFLSLSVIFVLVFVTFLSSLLTQTLFQIYNSELISNSNKVEQSTNHKQFGQQLKCLLSSALLLLYECISKEGVLCHPKK